MDQQFLMGNGDGIVRNQIPSFAPTFISPNLKQRLTQAAMQMTFQSFRDFFDFPSPDFEYEQLLADYQAEFQDAVTLGLFQGGGIREKHHLMFWCLGRYLQPSVYIESGVFTGSSLHAYLKSPQLKEIVAIDPDLSHLRIPIEQIPEPALIDNLDFSQLELETGEATILAYFDDHINSAHRIIQSAAKGLRYLVFDDSTGYEGICQRLYPATPTVPMIMQSEWFTEGDEIRWTFRNPKHGNIQSTWKATAPQIELCRHAKSLIKKSAKLPELNDYIPQLAPEKLPDASKYIVELKI